MVTWRMGVHVRGGGYGNENRYEDWEMVKWRMEVRVRGGYGNEDGDDG